MNHTRGQSLIALFMLFFSGLAEASVADFQQAVSQLLPWDGQRFASLADGQTVYGKFFILRMYQENAGKPLWSPAATASLARAIASLDEDGLNPDDYRFSDIRPNLQQPQQLPTSPLAAATADILLTEAYLRALYNLYYGKTDPEQLDPHDNFGRDRDGKDRSALLLTWVKAARIEDAFAWARPKNARYYWMRKALQEYQRIQAAGGWPQIPAGKTVEPGQKDRRIPLLRKRLAITDDLPSAKGPARLDDKLLDGILRFQERHYLSETGALDPETLEALNVPVEQRIDQIRVNLERQRWLFPVNSPEYLLVDIAGFTAFWVSGEEIIWQEQVQVGRKYTQTPVFKDHIRHIDFHPDWSATPGHERLHSQIRFLFPNRHGVFLHAADHMEMLTQRSRTTTPDGCIRISRPEELAVLLLQHEGWGDEPILETLEAKEPTKVELKKPLPILIHYSTAWATDAGVTFKPDVYNRDPALLAALNGPFIFHKKDLERDSPKSNYNNPVVTTQVD